MRAELDRAAFDPAHVFHAGSQTNQARIQAGEYQIVTLGFQTNVAGWRVERVLGVEPLRQFLTATAGGRWQTQEASYDPRSNVWFDVFGNDDRQPGEWGHWTGRGMNWNSMCAACHNTGLSKNYEAATDSYHTTMDEMAVGCGACHGSLAEHMDWQRAHPGGHGKDPTVTPLSPARMLGVCGSCHSRREEVAGGFTPGDSYFDHYEMETVDETDNWFADGQVRSEDYEFASFLGSKMRQRGVTCLDCHNPHSMKLLLPGNDLCLRCHSGAMTNAPVIVPIAHSHHAASSAGNQCVGCHMPVTVYMQRHARHDHGLTIPDPLLTKEWNVPNACNRCHADKSASWALDSTAQWYGEKMNRPTRDRARLIAAAQRGKESARTPLTRMTGAAGESPYWRAVAAGLLWRWTDNAAVQAALLASLKDEHPLVRAKAVKSLEPLADEEDRAVVAALQPLLEDPVRTVRLAAAWALKSSLDPGSGAGRELSAMLELNGDQPAGQYRLAQFAHGPKTTGGRCRAPAFGGEVGPILAAAPLRPGASVESIRIDKRSGGGIAGAVPPGTRFGRRPVPTRPGAGRSGPEGRRPASAAGSGQTGPGTRPRLVQSWSGLERRRPDRQVSRSVGQGRGAGARQPADSMRPRPDPGPRRPFR